MESQVGGPWKYDAEGYLMHVTGCPGETGCTCGLPNDVECHHDFEDFEKLAEGVYKCRKCGMVEDYRKAE